MRVNVRHCYGSGSRSDQGIQWEWTLTINGSIHILCCKTLLNTFFPVTISTILAILEPILNREGSAALTLIPFIQMDHRSRLLLPFIFSFFVTPYIYISYPFLIHQSLPSCWLRSYPLLVQVYLNLFNLPLYYTRFTSIAYISIPQPIQPTTLMVKIHIRYSFKFTPTPHGAFSSEPSPPLRPLSIDLLGVLWSRKRTKPGDYNCANIAKRT